MEAGKDAASKIRKVIIPLLNWDILFSLCRSIARASESIRTAVGLGRMNSLAGPQKKEKCEERREKRGIVGGNDDAICLTMPGQVAQPVLAGSPGLIAQRGAGLQSSRATLLLSSIPSNEPASIDDEKFAGFLSYSVLKRNFFLSLFFFSSLFFPVPFFFNYS